MFNFKKNIPSISWGEKTLEKRGVIIPGFNNRNKNCMGGPFGPFAFNRALAISTNRLKNGLDAECSYIHQFLTPSDHWFNVNKIVSIDPWGCPSYETVKKYNDAGIRIYSSISGCKAKLDISEIRNAIHSKILYNDGKVLEKNRIIVNKFAINPVWYLPGIANRLQISEIDLRKSLYECTGGGYHELVKNHKMKVFLPPYNGITIYCIGNMSSLNAHNASIGVRIHDECNSSDVFGSTICTCRPYLIYSLIQMVKLAQNKGIGVLIYNRQEGKGFGEVSKFQVYHSRNQDKNGQNYQHYYNFTKNILHAEDLRFHEFSSDALLWLGINSIDFFYSMSPTKYDAVLNAGIKIKNRVALPESFIDADAMAEITAKKIYANYYYDIDQSKSKVGEI